MLSPDEKILYVTNGPVVVAFDVQPDGTVRNQRDFAKLEAGGAGDGMAVDAAGRLYVTSQPGVQVFSAEGKYLGLDSDAARGHERGILGARQEDALRVGSRRAQCRWHRDRDAAGGQEQRQVDLQDPDARAGLHGTRQVTSSVRLKAARVPVRERIVRVHRS